MHDSLLERPTLDPAKLSGLHILSTVSQLTGKSISKASERMQGRDGLISPRGPYIRTYTGVKFYPFDPRPDQVFIEDIAHALSNLCRFGGHSRFFYSVAEHSYLMSEYVERSGAVNTSLWALLHDASEAYLVDLPKPIKELMPQYAWVERKVMEAIIAQYDLSWPEPPMVRELDHRILHDERLAMMSDLEGELEIEPLGVHVQGWNPRLAEKSFLRQFHQLSEKRSK